MAVAGFGAVALGSQVRKVDGQHAGTDGLMAAPSSPSPHAGGASAADVTDGEAGP